MRPPLLLGGVLPFPRSSGGRGWGLGGRFHNSLPRNPPGAQHRHRLVRSASQVNDRLPGFALTERRQAQPHLAIMPFSTSVAASADSLRPVAALPRPTPKPFYAPSSAS